MKTILPGATIGVLGSGQLGRMFTLAARRMGYRVHTFSPDEDTPTGQVADLEVQASYDDTERVREWAREIWNAWSEHHDLAKLLIAKAAGENNNR